MTTTGAATTDKTTGRATIASVRAALESGSIKAAELAEQHYERIAAENPEINCYLALSRDRALAQAERPT